jgi:hypothetical protein
MGDGLVSTSAQGPQVGGGSRLSGLHGHSLVVVVVTGGFVVVTGGGGTASVVVIACGGPAGACSVVVGIVVVDEDGTVEFGPLDAEDGLEVEGTALIQVEPGFVGSLVCFPEPSRSTPSSTPANADAATAEPHAAQSTRTAISFRGITRTSRGWGFVRDSTGGSTRDKCVDGTWSSNSGSTGAPRNSVPPPFSEFADFRVDALTGKNGAPANFPLTGWTGGGHLRVPCTRSGETSSTPRVTCR